MPNEYFFIVNKNSGEKIGFPDKIDMPFSILRISNGVHVLFKGGQYWEERHDLDFNLFTHLELKKVYG